LRHRVLGNPEISTDGYLPYLKAVDLSFLGQSPHGIVDKQTVFINGTNQAGNQSQNPHCPMPSSNTAAGDHILGKHRRGLQ
jgi:hypothetical protein